MLKVSSETASVGVGREEADIKSCLCPCQWSEECQREEIKDDLKYW